MAEYSVRPNLLPQADSGSVGEAIAWADEVYERCFDACARTVSNALDLPVGGRFFFKQGARGIRPVKSAAVMGLTDLTMLGAEATGADIDALCRKAVEGGARSVCVNSSRVQRITQFLQGTQVLPIAVVGFPLGAATPAAVAAEAAEAVAAGAREIETVLPVGRLLEGDLRRTFETILTVREAVPTAGLKVILEASLLTPELIIQACLVAREARAEFVQTATGVLADGAVEANVALMRRAAGTTLHVKALGGIHTMAAARRMVAAGADVIGAAWLDGDGAG